MTAPRLRLFHPTDAGWISAQHGALYREEAGFDATFEPLVASILAEFIATADPERECGWVIETQQERLGCIFCRRLSVEVAQLRLFLLVPQARGQGLGQRLLETCVGFARENGYHTLRLWTHESHVAACALYRRNGFYLTGARPVRSFGCDLIEQSWELPL